VRLYTQLTSELVDGASPALWVDAPQRVTLQVISGPTSFGAHAEGSLDGENWYSLGASVSEGIPVDSGPSVLHVAAFLRVRFDLPAAGTTTPIVVAVAAE
jgi:hypothetical protein